jgi:magnesium-transporting ATPase (P-type)
MNKPHAPPSTSQSSVPLQPLPPTVAPLTVENVLWSNTVLAAGSAVGFVIYTGAETRAVMNTSHPETKIGLLDLEINKLAKVCSLDIEWDSVNKFLDPLRCHLCTIAGPRRPKWVSRPVVCLRIPFSHPLLLYHSHQSAGQP